MAEYLSGIWEQEFTTDSKSRGIETMSWSSSPQTIAGLETSGISLQVQLRVFLTQAIAFSWPLAIPVC